MSIDEAKEFVHDRELYLREIPKMKNAGSVAIKILNSMVRMLSMREAPTLRMDILLSSALRAIRSVQAMTILGDAGLVEDMSALSRTLIETVTTGCYLQLAPESELNAFRYFPVISEHKNLARFEKQFGPMECIDTEIRAALGEEKRKVIAVSGKLEKAQSWTNTPVWERAKLIDERLDSPVFGTFIDSAYLDGHAFVHGTQPALDFQLQILKSGTINQDDVLFQTMLMLHAAAIVLHAMAIFINLEHNLVMKDQISELTALLV